MTATTGPTNPTLKGLIGQMKKNKAPFWQRLAKELERPTRQRRAVNVDHLEEQAKNPKEILVIPGKVLAEGIYTKKNTIAAWQFSQKAKEHIQKSAKTMSLQELLKENPKAKGVRIIG